MFYPPLTVWATPHVTTAPVVSWKWQPAALGSLSGLSCPAALWPSAPGGPFPPEPTCRAGSEACSPLGFVPAGPWAVSGGQGRWASWPLGLAPTGLHSCCPVCGAARVCVPFAALTNRPRSLQPWEGPRPTWHVVESSGPHSSVCLACPLSVVPYGHPVAAYTYLLFWRPGTGGGLPGALCCAVSRDLFLNPVLLALQNGYSIIRYLRRTNTRGCSSRTVSSHSLGGKKEAACLLLPTPTPLFPPALRSSTHITC